MEKIITEQLILFDAEVESKEEAIRLLAQRMEQEGRLNNLEGYISDVLKREETFSTGVGFLVATPHAKSSYADVATIGFARLKKEIAWDEDEMVSIIFQLAIPLQDKGDRHLQILAALSRKLIHDEFREAIASATSPQQIIELIGEV